MRELSFKGRLLRGLLPAITTIALAFSLIGVLVFSPAGVTGTVFADTTSVPINMIFYGWHDDTTDQRIINARPEFLVDNSPAGPWKGNADIGKFESAGIKYFEYIDGGYEGTQSRSIPNDLQSNLNFITAAAQAGSYGIFLDEVSDGIYTTPNYNYLQQIADKAHGLGLKVVFNTGMDNWADQLMNYADYVNSSEVWNNAPLTTSQSKWASRTWVLRQGVNDATTAAALTEAAWSKGLGSAYACNAYTGLPAWLESYVSQVQTYTAPTPDFSLNVNPSTISFTTGGSGTFNVSISPSGGFAGTVTLSATSTPSGLTVTPATASVAPSYPVTSFTATSSTTGTFTANITGTSGTLTHTTSVKVVVNAPSSPALSVSLSTNMGSYKVGQTVTSKVTVKSSASSVGNATVTFSIKNRFGTTVSSGSGTTGSAGTMQFTWNTKGATRGTYTVQVSASKSGYTSGSGSTSFTIR